MAERPPNAGRERIQTQVIPQVTPQMPPVAPVPSAAPAASGSAPSSQRSPPMSGPNSYPSTRTRVPTGPQFAQPPGQVITVQFPQAGTSLASPRGTYVIRDVLGSGEFGAVYDSIGPFDQVYALKMMRPSNRPYQEVYTEWAKEVQRLMSLRHPNVVYIHDAFEQDHLFYLALERCDHPLTAMLGAPMQEGLVLELGRQLLAAIQFLHDNDVVHDDLHPGNVLITHQDRPLVKIADFGISHELRGMAAIRPNVVHHAIMAPEILATGFTTKQSDLYQLGLLLYWMLVGSPAIDKNLPYPELTKMVADGEPRKRAEAVGTPLGALIAKMLRRREAFRYSSPREVWADLRELPAWQNRHLFPIK